MFPPGWSVHSPYLGLPLLAASLRQAGHRCSITDANLEFYDSILSAAGILELRPKLNEAERSLRSQGCLQSKEAELVFAAKASIGVVEACIGDAKDVLRTPNLFVDETQRDWALGIVSQAFNIFRAVYRGTEIDFSRIEVAAQSELNAAGLIALTQDTERNPFCSFFATRIGSWLKDNPDFLGISVTDSPQLLSALTLARLVKRDRPDMRIVLGGNYVTRLAALSDDTLLPLFAHVDVVIRSEGEKAIIDLAALCDGSLVGYDQISNAAYLANDMICRNEITEVDLNGLPCPDFDGIPIHKYFSPAPLFPLLTSRSCAHSCAFCSIPWASNRFRTRDGAAIAEDMNTLRVKYGARYFVFVDETLEPGVLAKLIPAIPSNMRWYGETRFGPRFSDTTFVQGLRQSGCRLLQFGLESYNQRVLDIMRKGTNQKDVRPNLETLLQNGIAFHLFAFVGFPGEELAEALNTARFLQEISSVARKQYGIRFCSHGLGVFGLDRFSPVAQAPVEFGVILGTPPAPLSLQLPYSVLSGLSGEESARLLESLADSTVVSEIEQSTGRRWLHTATRTQVSREEWNFLSLCFQEDRLRKSRRALRDSTKHVSVDLDYTWLPPRTDSRMSYDGKTARFCSGSGLGNRKLRRQFVSRGSNRSLEFHPETELLTLDDGRALLANHHLERALVLGSSAELIIALVQRFDSIKDMIEAAQGVLNETDLRRYISQLRDEGFLVSSDVRSEEFA